MSFLASSALL